MTDLEDDHIPHQKEPIQERRRLIIDLALLSLIGLLVQGFWVWQVTEPTYMDGYYYTTNAQRLSSGEGFTEMVIWQYLDNPDELPTASHTYWMPLTSMIGAAGYFIREDFRGAQIFFWLLGGLLPLLAYCISSLLVGERWQAWVAALFTAAGGYYAAFMSQPTTFAPFAWAGASCLLFIGLATSHRSILRANSRFPFRHNSRFRIVFLFSAGLTAGIAHLARADGLLLLLVALIIWLLFGAKSLDENNPLVSLASKKEPGKRSVAIQLTAGAILILAGYLIIMGIWLLRNWQVTGSPLPIGGSQSLYLTTYDDIFAYGRESDFRSFIEWGWNNILRSKLVGLSTSMQTYIAVVGLIFLMPFVVLGFIGGYRNSYRRDLLRPPIWYAVALFLIMSLLFTFPGIRGSLFHSSVALWPWSMALAALGIANAIDWASQRLSHWQTDKAKPRFSVMFIIVAFVLSFVISWPRTQVREESALFEEIDSQLPGTAIVMTGNAPSFFYHTGRAAINVPNESPKTLVEVAERYGASYLILDENHPEPLVDLYHSNGSYPDIKLLESYDGLKLYELNIHGS